MKALFDKVSHQAAKNTTRTYSTSFSLGIYFLESEMRRPIYDIYGFVRFADEIVDSFEGYEQVYLFEKFREDTYEAIEKKISLNPVLNAFQHTVHDYGIETELIDTFLDSMEMDLHKTGYNRDQYEQYILGSAEVVGLMCLRVFTDGDPELYEHLRVPAKKLGSAFQKINFLRDLQDDFDGLGRTYFPGVDLHCFTREDKQRIEKEIRQDFDEALLGIRQLPAGARKGVYLAYVYYRSLLTKISGTAAENVMKKRIRIPGRLKFGLMINSLVRHHLNVL